MKEIWGKVQKMMGWFLIVLLLGFIAGWYMSTWMVIDPRLDDAVALKGIVIKNVPYDLKVRL
jgi:hypothetical protein